MADNKQNSETGNIDSAKDNKATADTGGAFSSRPAKDISSTTDKANTPSSVSDKVSLPSGGAVNVPKDIVNKAMESKPFENRPTENKPTENKPADSVGVITTEAIGQAKDKASSLLGEQKTNLASSVASVADSIRQVGENFGKSNENNQIASLAGKYGDSLAGQVEKFSSYIEDKEFKELIRDVEQFARRNPALFVGGAFALGIVAARFLKSSNRNQSSGRRSQNNRADNSSAGGNRQSSGV